MHSAMVKEMKGKTNPRTGKPYSEDEIWAMAQSAFKKMKDKGESKEGYESKYLSSIEFKEEEGLLWIHGPINAPVLDDKGDYIPVSVQRKIVDQINAGFNKGSRHHDIASTPLWIAKEAYLGNDGKSYVKGYLNPHHEEFDKASWEVKNGILDTFSIEYLSNPPSHIEEVEGKKARVFDDIQLRGIGLASKGRAINPALEPLEFYVKERISFENLEVKQLNETKEETKMVDVKENVTPAVAPVVPAVEHKEFSEDDIRRLKELKVLEVKEREEKEFQDRFKKELDKMRVASKPMIQPGKVENKENSGGMLEFKEKLASGARWAYNPEFKNYAPMLSAKEHLNLATEMAVKSGAFETGKEWTTSTREFKCSGAIGQNLEVKELEFKGALTTTSNDPATWAVANYYQSSVEIGDFYDPVIFNVLNDKTTTYGRLPKRDMSRFSSITRRVRSGRNSTAGAYVEGEALTKSFSERIRLSQPFRFYKAGVQVTGQMVASARAEGGVGDVFAIELQDAARDLLRQINYDLLNSAGGAYTAQKGALTDKEIMSFEYVCDSTQNTVLYGHTRSSYAFLASGNDTAAGSTPITKQRIRTAVQALEKNGADRNNLVIFTSYEQRDMILKLFDDAQRFNGVSARGGFEGLPTFDGVPLFADHLCNTDHLFIMDVSVCYLGIQVPPTFEPLAQNDDSRSGFIKSYLNFMCEAPFWCGQIDGLSTS